MINHFKAEFYKLRHSKILITILGVCAAVIMVSFALGDMTFFGAGDGTESVIGFKLSVIYLVKYQRFKLLPAHLLHIQPFSGLLALFATIFFIKRI